MWCPRRRERGATVSAVLLNRPDKHKYTQNKTLSNISHAQILRNRLSPSKPRPLKAQVQDTSSTLRTGVKSRITDDNDILFSFFIYCTLCHFPSLVLWKTPLCVTPPPPPLRGHVQRGPLQLPLPGDFSLSGPPHPGATGVRREASQGSAPVAPGH